MSMIPRSLACLGPHGFHRLAYWEWPGPPGARHRAVRARAHPQRPRFRRAGGRSRRPNAASSAPIFPAAARSEWLSHPGDYGYPLYLADMAALIARLDAETLDWVGTSMGGLTGMLLAAQPGAPIRRLVVNDIGPLIAKEGLMRIGSYVGRDPSFADEAALEAALRQVAASFGPLSEAQWRHLAAVSARRKPDGSLGFAYDPRIGDAFREAPAADIDLWASWDAISCPTLVLRGAESDLLRAADAKAMTERGPRARLVEFPGVGHAPALMEPGQIAVIRDFLLG